MPSITNNQQFGIGISKSAIGNWQWAIAFAISASFLTIIPAILWGVPSNLDLTNHFRFAVPFYDAITAGDLYPGWLAVSNGGYGDPSFRFYPPALYYLLAGARFITGNWYSATLIVFVALSVAGGLGMYFWAKSILASPASGWAALFYALAPYHLNQLFQATLLAEWAGSAVLPFVFGFVERVCERGKARDIAGLAITYGLLLFTHLPLAIIGSLALAVYALARIQAPARLRTLAKLTVAAVLGLSVSAVYWVTMVSELGWISVNQIQHDSSVDYRFNFLLSTFSPDNLNVWWMNIMLLMTLLLFAPVLLRAVGVSRASLECGALAPLWPKRRQRESPARQPRWGGRGGALQGGAPPYKSVWPVVAFTLVALFMSLPLSRPVWWLFRPLQETQFPWRWLTLISMGGSILTAATLPALLKSNGTKRILALGAMAVSVAFTFSHVVREAQYFPPQKFESMLTDVRGTSCVNYWFPIWAQPNPRKMITEVEAADRAVNVTVWEPEHRKFSIAAGPATEARVRTFYYPHWIATSEAGILPARPDKDGALLIFLPQNATSVALDFREPQKTKFSTIMSLSGLIITGALAVPFRRRRTDD